MGKKKGQKKVQSNPEGSSQAPNRQENPEQSGQGSSQSQAHQQQSGVREQSQAPHDDQPQLQGRDEPGSGSSGQRQSRDQPREGKSIEERSADQRQTSVPSQSSAMPKPAAAGSKKQKLPASEQGKNSEQAVKQPTSGLKEVPQSLDVTTPARISSAPSAETKIKGISGSGGQSTQQITTTTSQISEQSVPAESKSSKKKQKNKNLEGQKPAASATPSPSTSGVGGVTTDMEKLTLKTKSQASAQQTTSAQPPIEKPTESKSKGKGKSQAQLPQQSAASTTQEKIPLKSSETKASGKKQTSKGSEAPKAAASATPSPSTSKVGDTSAEAGKTPTFIIPKRQGPLCDGIHAKVVHKEQYVQRELKIEVNYLPLKIDKEKAQLKIYHYDVKFVSKTSKSPSKTSKFPPKYPVFLLRLVLEEMKRQNEHLRGRYPAFDGRSNLYVAGTPLKADTIRDSVEVANPENGKVREFDVTISRTSDNLTISDLWEHCKNGITSNTPQSVIQATDIALRSGLTSFTQAGRSFFMKPIKPVELGNGMELWNGFYQSVVPGWQPYVNIDVANKAFPVEQPVLDYLKYDMRLPENVLQSGLAPYQKEQLRDFIKGLKVSYRMPCPGGEPQKRIYRVTGLGGSSIDESFEFENRRITVDIYYRSVKKQNITYKKLPLLRLGNEGSFMPIELCTIIGNQVVQKKLNEKQTSNMVRAAARPTYERKMRIAQSIKEAGYDRNPMLKEFGIEVDTKFQQVNAVVISPPQIAYGKKVVPVSRGTWSSNNDSFKIPSPMPTWGILNLNRPTNKISELEKLMITAGTELKMYISRSQHYIGLDRRFVSEDQIIAYLREFMEKKIQLVIVILADSSENYGQVKRASELQVGVLTQCLKSRTLERINSMIVNNILLKVNAKLKGVNHCIAPTWTPRLLTRPFMLVGADVTHPAPGAENTPSIAGVVASRDIYGFQYSSNYRLQPAKQEMISELAVMMEEHLENFRKKFNCLPENIFYFRDGVSEGQFQKVLESELTAIQRACAKMKPAKEIGVLFVVVQKRHHTRFFPLNKNDGDNNGNVPAGTLVDHTITHPTEFDYFLVSHQSIQGTARPTKYHLLFDSIDYSTLNPPIEINDRHFELERLTYYLCHMFARCLRSVSYPAPTYYAHLVAFRGRAHWDKRPLDMTRLRQEQERRGTINPIILENHPMFFT